MGTWKGLRSDRGKVAVSQRRRGVFREREKTVSPRHERLKTQRDHQQKQNENRTVSHNRQHRPGRRAAASAAEGSSGQRPMDDAASLLLAPGREGQGRSPKPPRGTRRFRSTHLHCKCYSLPPPLDSGSPEASPLPCSWR